jgi:membrane associated rhomboid family serine protease
MSEPVRILRVKYDGYYKFLRAGTFCRRLNIGEPLQLGTWHEYHWDYGSEGELHVEWVGGKPPYRVVSQWMGGVVETSDTHVTLRREMNYGVGGPFTVWVTDADGISDWFEDHAIHYCDRERLDFMAGCEPGRAGYCERQCYPPPDGRITVRVSSGGTVYVNREEYRDGNYQLTKPFGEEVYIYASADEGYVLDYIAVDGRRKYYVPFTVTPYDRIVDVFAFFRRVEAPKPPEQPPPPPEKPKPEPTELPDPWESLKELLRKVLRDEEPVAINPFVTKALISLMFTVLAYTISQIDAFALAYGLIPSLLAVEWWRVLTNMWLHGSWEHYIGNMLFLYVFGDNVEERFGYVKYAAFYVTAGIFAGLGWAAYALAVPGLADVPAVGASGAISGVMGAYAVLFPRAYVIFLGKRVPAPAFLAIWFLSQFALAFQLTAVAWMAHVVGFAYGLAVGYVTRRATVEDEAA